MKTKEKKEKVAEYKILASNKSDFDRGEVNKDKSGVPLGVYAINPVNNVEIPIWIADYVLMSYGTGAIMAVPGHDERDYEFAKKFRLPIVEVVSGGDIEKKAHIETKDGLIMGVRHKKYNVHGVQFHPESIKTKIGIKILKNFIRI